MPEALPAASLSPVLPSEKLLSPGRVPRRAPGAPGPPILPLPSIFMPCHHPLVTAPSCTAALNKS